MTGIPVAGLCRVGVNKSVPSAITLPVHAWKSQPLFCLPTTLISLGAHSLCDPLRKDSKTRIAKPKGGTLRVLHGRWW